MRIVRLAILLGLIYILLKKHGLGTPIARPSVTGGRWVRKFGLAILLGFVYILITGDATVMNCLVGLVVGATITRVCKLGGANGDARQALRKLGAVPLFAMGTAQELTRGSWTMLRVLLGQEDWRKMGFVEIPVGERSPSGAVISALVATAAPGGVLIEIDWPKGIMNFHVIDATAPEEIRADSERFYQKFQKPVLP